MAALDYLRRQGASPRGFGYNDVGTIQGSEFEDPSDDVRNPYYQGLRRQTDSLRILRAQADTAERLADPDQARQDRIEDQLDQDYDTEYRAPSRARIVGDINRAEASRNAHSAARDYFDDWVTRQREDTTNQRARLFSAQYGAPAAAKVSAAELTAQAKVAAAREAAGASRDVAETNAGARRAGQMTNPLTGTVDPSLQPRVDQYDRSIGILKNSGGQVFPQSLLQEFADAHHGGDIGAARQHITQQGYVIDPNR